MLTLGIASSHAPTMFLPADEWPGLHQTLVGDVPQPKAVAQETLEVREGYKRRIDDGFATLAKALKAARPDILIIVGDDQSEVFGPAFNPALAVFCGPEVSGTVNIRLVGQDPSQNHRQFKCRSDIANRIATELIERGFDTAVMTELKPLSRPEAGLGHAFVRTANVMGVAEAGIPILPIFINAYHPPLPTAQRCYDLGRTLREIVASWPERVAIYGSGGLSHDPRGPRAGWIDEPLDRWVLERLTTGRTQELTKLFAFDSATLRGGSGEIRSWIVTAGAFEGVPAKVVDYIPVHHAVTGLGFAYWPESHGLAD